MGLNKWQTADTWPPAGAQPMTFYLSSAGKANTLDGDGLLAPAPPASDAPDAFTYEPMNPVTSYGGNVCCTGTPSRRILRPAQDGDAAGHSGLHIRAVQGGRRGQRADRADALRVVRREGHRLHREGDRRVSRRPRLQPGRVHPADALSRRPTTGRSCDGRGQGLQGHAAAAHDEQLLRGRGHRLRIEVSSSNFPRFDATSTPVATSTTRTRAWWRTTRCTTRSSIRRRSPSRWSSAERSAEKAPLFGSEDTCRSAVKSACWCGRGGPSGPPSRQEFPMHRPLRRLTPVVLLLVALSWPPARSPRAPRGHNRARKSGVPRKGLGADREAGIDRLFLARLQALRAWLQSIDTTGLMVAVAGGRSSSTAT